MFQNVLGGLRVVGTVDRLHPPTAISDWNLPELPPAERKGWQQEGMPTGERDAHPDMNLVSTSYVERQNLTMRMSMRRFTRLTNAHSKKIENHIHAIALHYMYYNFARIHSTLRCSPAMAAGVSNTLWSIEDIVSLLD